MIGEQSPASEQGRTTISNAISFRLAAGPPSGLEAARTLLETDYERRKNAGSDRGGPGFCGST